MASLEVVQNRIAPTSMETRNAIGLYDAEKDSYTLYSGNQGSATLRGAVAKGILNIPLEKLRVVNKDVGGGFGMKGFMYPEQPLVLIAAKLVGARCAGRPTAPRPSSATITARHDHQGRTGARQGWQDPGDARHRHGEHGRLSFAIRPVHRDDGGRGASMAASIACPRCSPR